jgi:hypothetical protein
MDINCKTLFGKEVENAWSNIANQTIKGDKNLRFATLL